MQQGRIVQISDPVTIYENPINEFVGNFVGKANILKGSVKAIEHEMAHVEVGDGIIAAIRHNRAQLHVGERVHIMVRPERVVLDSQRMDKNNCFPVDIRRAYYLGNKSYYEAMLGENKLIIDMANHRGSSVYSEDEHVYAAWTADDSIYYPVQE